MLRGDGNENGKKTHRSNQQNLHVQCTFLYISLPCFARLQRQNFQKLPNLRWLDTVFQGQYLASLSINYVAVNKDLEKLSPHGCIR